MASMEVSVADELRQLMAKKDAMEKEIKELMTVLESVGTLNIAIHEKHHYSDRYRKETGLNH